MAGHEPRPLPVAFCVAWDLLLMRYREPPKVEKFNTPTADTTPHLAFPALFSIPSYP